jgi:hypothetical protein
MERGNTTELDPHQLAVPHLPAITARQQDVVDGLDPLVTHDAGIVGLNAMAPPPLRCPTTPMQNQLEKEACPRRRRHPPNFFSAEGLRRT